jgi:hypothetical protein
VKTIRSLSTQHRSMHRGGRYIIRGSAFPRVCIHRLVAMRLSSPHRDVGAAWLSGQRRLKGNNPGYAWEGTGYEHTKILACVVMTSPTTMQHTMYAISARELCRCPRRPAQEWRAVRRLAGPTAWFLECSPGRCNQCRCFSNCVRPG